MSFQERSRGYRKGWLYLLIVLLLLLILLPAAGTIAQEGTGGPTTSDTRQVSDGDDYAIRDESVVEAPAEVLVIQDTASWNVNIGPDILGKHGVSYETITSAQLAAKDLSPYKMVAVPSVQTEAFYTAWNNQFDKIDTYVMNGGILWLSAANYQSTKPKIPGGVTLIADNSTFNDILLPSHPWARGVPNPAEGNRLSHWSLADIYPGSAVIAASQNEPKRPTLVDYQYGKGRVALNSQFSEHSWYNDYSGGALLPNTLIDLLGYRVLIIQDGPSWGGYQQQIVFNNYRVKFNQVTSSQLFYVNSADKINLTPYEMLVVPSRQSEPYYTNWNKNFDAVIDYLKAGGKLWQSTANDVNLPVPEIPGTITGQNVSVYDNANIVVASDHPWLRGATSPIWGTAASHDDYSGINKSHTVVAKSSVTNRPVLVDYMYGPGRVLATGQTLENMAAFNQGGEPILENSLIDLLGAGVIYMPTLFKNFCADFGSSEIEPNDKDFQANGQLCLGKNYTGNPNNNGGGATAEDSDWFFVYWNGQGTLNVTVTDYLQDGQMLLYHESNTSSYVKWILPQSSGTYILNYNGAAGAGIYYVRPGIYYVRLFAPQNHPTNTGDYTLKATVN